MWFNKVGVAVTMTDLLYVFLPRPGEGAGVIAAEDEDGIVVRMGVGRVEHREEALLLSRRELVSQVKQHPCRAVCLQERQ